MRKMCINFEINQRFSVVLVAFGCFHRPHIVTFFALFQYTFLRIEWCFFFLRDLTFAPIYQIIGEMFWKHQHTGCSRRYINDDASERTKTRSMLFNYQKPNSSTVEQSRCDGMCQKVLNRGFSLSWIKRNKKLILIRNVDGGIVDGIPQNFGTFRRFEIYFLY